MSFSENIKRLRKEKDMTQEEFAIFLEKKRSTITTYELGNSVPTLSDVIEIAKKLSITVDELIGENNNVKKNNILPSSEVVRVEVPRYNVVVMQGVEALASPLGFESQVQALPDRLLWLPQLEKGRDYFAIEVRGDSMSPYYEDCDIIVISLVASALDYIEDRIYVAVMKTGGVFVKRLRSCLFGANKGALELISENPRYKSIFVDPADLFRLYEINMRLSIPK